MHRYSMELMLQLTCFICCVFATDFTKLFETRIIPRTGDPVWNEAHTVAVAHDVRNLRFLIKDSDRLSVEHVAEVKYIACHCCISCP